MRNHLKQLTALVASLVFLLVLGSAALAAPSFQVEINGVDVTTSDVIRLERGDHVEIEVIVEDDVDDWEDARLEAKIGGYEYGVIRDTSKIFDLKANMKAKKVLAFDLPDDLEADDYDLRIELSNGDGNSFEETFDVAVESVRHKVSIQDVILRPGHSVAAGSALFATVRVENLGDRKEDDIKATVSVPDLRISARTHVHELTNERVPD